MRSFSLPRRWLQRRPSLSQPWRHNPWIRSPQPDNDESAAEQEKGQQKAAIGTWEDEGGSIRTDRSRS